MNYRSAILCWLALLALLAASLAAAMLGNTALRHTLHLLCAVAMAALVMVVFMRLRSAGQVLRLVALAGLLWIALLIMLTMADVLTR